MKINTLNDISREEEAIATKKLEAKKKKKNLVEKSSRGWKQTQRQ
jgi:hypothetical protein